MESTSLNWESTGAADEDVLLRDALGILEDLRDGDLELMAPRHDGGVGVFHSANDGLCSSLLVADPLLLMPKHSMEPSAPTETEAPPLAVVAMTDCAGAKPKNRFRGKRREELLYLRQLATKLESQLIQLKAKAERAHHGNTANPVRSPSSTLRLVACHQIASRQYEQRQRCEMENIKLKRLLEDQIQLGKSLKRILRKRPKIEIDTPQVRVEQSSDRDRVRPSWDDHHVFHALLASMESQYAETPRVLANVQQRFHDPTTNGRHTELVRDERLGMVLRTTESRLLPFSYEVAVQAFWSTTPTTKEADLRSPRAFPVHNCYGAFIDRRLLLARQDLEVSDDFIKTQFRAHATFGRTSGDLTVCMVDQRYQEAGRTVVLSAGLIEPTVIGNTSMNGVCMRHRGWAVLEPVLRQVDARATTKAVTKMTMYILTEPEVVDDRQDHTGQVETLTAFMKLAVASELEARHEVFENCLFDLHARAP